MEPTDWVGESLTPLSELIDEVDFPLSEYWSAPRTSTAEAGPGVGGSSFFDKLFYANAVTSFDSRNTIIELDLFVGGAFPALSLPGLSDFKIQIGAGDDGWTRAVATIVLGPDFSVRLDKVGISLVFPPEVLANKQTGKGAALTIDVGLSFTPDGLRFIRDGKGKAKLATAALIGGTELEINVAGADLNLPGFGEPPPDQPDFHGVSFDDLKLIIPPSYLGQDGAQRPIELSGKNVRIGTTGITGEFLYKGSTIERNLFGFDSRLRSCEISFYENAIRSSALKADIKLSVKDKDSWVGIEVGFGPNNARDALLPVEEQPASAGARDGYPLVIEIEKLFELSVRSLRILKEGSTWTLYCSGKLKPLIDQDGSSTTWPDLEFDEIGISSTGDFVLPEGSGIAFSSPMVVDWNSVTLTISKFRLGRPQATRAELQGAIELQLSAEVEIIEGIPAGASVDGLVVIWSPKRGIVDTRLDGIGIEFGVPGSFSAGLELSYSTDEGTSFKGKGHLDLESLDIRAEVGAAAGTKGPTRFFYLFADVELYPGGIPIGSTGLSLYGLQGLLAYNMALKGLAKPTPHNRRYFEVFNQPKVGLTDVNKWEVKAGASAIGFGVVIGTADDGTVFNCRGMLIVTLPDLDLILQARATFIEKRQGMSEARPGALDTLLIYRTGDSTITFDVRAEWTKEKIYSVSGTAHAVFKLNDPSKFQIQLGENSPGRRIGAKVVRWGNEWLFISGFWLKIEQSSCAVGAVIDIGLRYQMGDFWAEASGSASANAILTWKPAQLDGKATLEGRVGIGCGGLGLSASLSGEPGIKVPTPLEFHVPLRACIHIDLLAGC